MRTLIFLEKKGNGLEIVLLFIGQRKAGKRIRRGARLWTVAVSTFKTETYRFLRLARPTDEDLAAGTPVPAGTIHLPSWVESEWVKQLVAEQLVTIKTKRGFQRLEWQKLRERNEALDARVYARAAAWICGLDRWSEARWAAREADLKDQARPTGTRRPARDASDSPPATATGRPWLPRQRGWLHRSE